MTVAVGLWGRRRAQQLQLLRDELCVIHVGCRSVSHGGVAFNLWDVGGCDKIRPLWRHYFQACSVFHRPNHLLSSSPPPPTPSSSSSSSSTVVTSSASPFRHPPSPPHPSTLNKFPIAKTSRPSSNLSPNPNCSVTPTQPHPLKTAHLGCCVAASRQRKFRY